MDLPAINSAAEDDEDSNMENRELIFKDKPKSYPRSTPKPKLFPIFQKNFRPVENNQLKDVQLEEEKNNNSRKRKRTMLAKDPQGMSQMVLDAGQKEIGPKFCDECGLLYCPGDFVDEEEHRKAHVRIQNTFKLTLWKDTEILFNYSDGCQVIMVQACDEKKMNKLKDFLAWLDSELGAGYDPSGKKKSDRVFLYITRTARKNVVRILGCGILDTTIDASKLSLQSLVDSSSADSCQNSLKVLVGITRLWTDSGFRRRNIASRIVERMRFFSGIPNCILPKENIGILEPSEAGKGFMAKFTNSRGVMYTYI